jgi:PTH1 family peptidyl-tRNA hydrolase
VKLIVGLGNPGRQYEHSRHNVGFRVADELGRRWEIDTSRERFHAWIGTGRIEQESVVLLKPTTFMNRSGRAVQAAGRFYQADLEDLLVVTDDFALPLGRLRMRSRGSAGGHNGLMDIVDRLGTEEFSRLRIGIGDAVGDPARFVLGRFSPDEECVVTRMVPRAADAVECWVQHGPEEAMNRFNGMPDIES